MATHGLQTTLHTRPPTTATINPHCAIYLWDHQNLITSKEQYTLRWKWSEIRLQNYYSEKFDLTIPQLSDINWYGHHNARKTMTTAEVNFAIKLTTNWLPVGEIAARYGALLTYCHRCNLPETLRHLLTCHENSTTKEAYIDAINNAMTKHGTNTAIQRTLIHGIRQYINLPSTYSIPPHLQYCFTTQSTFGWNLVCSGLLIQQWSEHQQSHLNTTPSNFSHLGGDSWNRKTSATLIQQAHQIWTKRCQEVHHPSTSTTPNQATIEATAQLRRFYEHASLVSATD